MNELERIIAEMDDAIGGDPDRFAPVLSEWRSRLAALAGAAPVAWMDSLLGNVSLPSEHVAGSNPAANGYIPLYPHAPAKARDVVPTIDLDQVFLASIRKAVAEQTWMPKEYVANDWQADILAYLREGPSTFAMTETPADLRERFNVWARTAGMDVTMRYGSYNESYTRHMWNAFQAGAKR